MHFGSVEEVERALEADAYLADRGLARAVYLALAMPRPLLLEFAIDTKFSPGRAHPGSVAARSLLCVFVRRMSACASLVVAGSCSGGRPSCRPHCDDGDAWRSGESLALFSRG